MNSKLSIPIITESFIVDYASMKECERLKEICNSWDEQELVEGNKVNDSYFYDCMNFGDLPPEGIQENYKLMMIKQLVDDAIVGYFDLYYGYPDPNTVWISIFVIDKQYRTAGLGRKVVQSIFKELSTCKWEKMGVGVYLKNWSALRFWTSLGFDKVLGIYGDKQYSSETFSLIGLQKFLAK